MSDEDEFFDRVGVEHAQRRFWVCRGKLPGGFDPGPVECTRLRTEDTAFPMVRCDVCSGMVIQCTCDWIGVYCIGSDADSSCPHEVEDLNRTNKT